MLCPRPWPLRVNAAYSSPVIRGSPSIMYGPNGKQVEWLLGFLRELPARRWRALEDRHAGASIEKEQDALAAALDRSGLREEWFALRHAATEIALRAAEAYAAEVGDQPRTLEHVAAVNAWDGQREVAFSEALPPAHKQAFVDASCAALGLVIMRPFMADTEFAPLWAAYEPVISLSSAESPPKP